MFMHQLTCKNKHLLKRFLAVALSAAMMCTGLPLTAHAAETAKPYVSLRTRFKTLQTGQSNRMTLKNNTIGWKITRAATADRTIAMVYDRTEDGFMIKGKSAGRTTVRARLKTTSRKKIHDQDCPLPRQCRPAGAARGAGPDTGSRILTGRTAGGTG